MPAAAKKPRKPKAAKPKKPGKAVKASDKPKSPPRRRKKPLRRAVDVVEATSPTPPPVPEPVPVPIPASAREVLVDRPLDGGPVRESLGFVQPGMAEALLPPVAEREPSMSDLLSQPFALPEGGTAWVQNVHWDVNQQSSYATLRITMVTNDAGTTPIQFGDPYVVNQAGVQEPVRFRRSPTSMQYHTQTQIDMDVLQTAQTTNAGMMEDLVQCLSDQLTMEFTNNMVGQPNNEATWNNWCSRQRLLTSASSGTFTVTNTSSATNATGGTLHYGGVFDDYTGNTVTGTNAWMSPSWVQAEHSKNMRNGIAGAVMPHLRRQAESTEERIAREEREIKAAAEREKRQAAQRKKEAARRRFQEEGKERARRLLASMLTPEQREEFEAENRFHLKVIDGKSGEERVYRIDQGYQGNVKLLGPDGRPIKSYCIHAKTTDDEGNRLPNEDHMLAQKLLLQTDEESFVRIANMTPVRH